MEAEKKNAIIIELGEIEVLHPENKLIPIVMAQPKMIPGYQLEQFTALI